MDEGKLKDAAAHIGRTVRRAIRKITGETADNEAPGKTGGTTDQTTGLIRAAAKE